MFKDKIRASSIEHALAAAETFSGLIIAAAKIAPNKKLSEVTLESLKKKFKTKAFAQRCDRSIILECEKIGISLDEFLEVGLKALQEISEELGM